MANRASKNLTIDVNHAFKEDKSTLERCKVPDIADTLIYWHRISNTVSPENAAAINFRRQLAIGIPQMLLSTSIEDADIKSMKFSEVTVPTEVLIDKHDHPLKHNLPKRGPPETWAFIYITLVEKPGHPGSIMTPKVEMKELGDRPLDTHNGPFSILAFPVSAIESTTTALYGLQDERIEVNDSTTSNFVEELIQKKVAQAQAARQTRPIVYQKHRTMTVKGGQFPLWDGVRTDEESWGSILQAFKDGCLLIEVVTNETVSVIN